MCTVSRYCTYTKAHKSVQKCTKTQKKAAETAVTLLSTPYRRRGHVTTRLAIPMRLRAAKRRTTRVFREKNKASHCCEKRLEFRAGLYCNAVTLRLCNIATASCLSSLFPL